MKANEAPYKIYVVDATFPDYVNFDGSPINTKRIDDHDIEYTRTDVFIEKACEYLQINLWRVVNEEPDFRQRFVTDFENYMKGE